MMPMVIASFLRLVTRPRIFVEPSPIADAVEFVDAMLVHAAARVRALRSSNEFGVRHGLPLAKCRLF